MFGRCTYDLPALPKWFSKTAENYRSVSINTANCETYSPANTRNGSCETRLNN